MIIDHGKVAYAEKEPGRDITVSNQPECRQLDKLMKCAQVSSAQAVLAKL